MSSRLPFGTGSVTLPPVIFPGLPEGFCPSIARESVPEKVTEEGPFMARFAAVKFALTSILLASAIASPLAQARSQADRAVEARLAVIRVVELPRQGRETYERIRQGGPFPYDKDGAVFGNRERQLPAEKRGFYREYTVATPGSRDRGARRIVCGGPARAPHACYYTADHYASFRQIVE
jgi:ribonuclease T1